MQVSLTFSLHNYRTLLFAGMLEWGMAGIPDRIKQLLWASSRMDEMTEATAKWSISHNEGQDGVWGNGDGGYTNG